MSSELLLGEEEFAPIDLQFGRLLSRLSDGGEVLLRLAMRASRAIRDGHSCLDLPALAAESGTDYDTWLKVLHGSPVVGAPGDWRPLILDEAGRLYLYRYWAAERQVAEACLARSRPVAVDEARLTAQLAALFSVPTPGGINWQKVAAATAALRQFCVISGGPGTGKTYTVVRILALLAGQQPARPPVVALAAPTGKAAARMQEAIRFAKQSLPVDEATRAAIPESASTIHRLLGARPNSVHFRHDRSNPLAVDVLVVDEASMVDLALMARLVDALPPRARLILLGDKSQLASVEAGSVLGDICAGAGGVSKPFARQLLQLTGERVPTVESAGPLADAVIYLHESRRFRGDGGIGRLAVLINAGQAEEALALLRRQDPQLDWQPIGGKALAAALPAAVVAGYQPYLRAVAAGAAAEDVFEQYNRFRVLCAHRSGPAGVEALNVRIEAALAAAHLLPRQGAWYAGRPVMITQNDYNLRLFNGDIGLTLPEVDGTLRVCFPMVDGSIRRLHPARLPAHETVYAMTVHKTQGSEFEHVLVVLPEEESRVLDRKLLYTAVTRAKAKVSLWGAAAVFARGVALAAMRGSGLAARLWPE
jgi:exodeoxyribonuclease V alpha subunit